MAGQVWGRATRPSLSNNGKILSSWLFRRKKIMKGTSPRACPFPFHRQSRAHTEIQLSALGTESHTVRSSDKLHSLAMDVKLGRLLELLSQLSQGKKECLPGETETIFFRRKWVSLTGQKYILRVKIIFNF
jgi:hypothetical protein